MKNIKSFLMALCLISTAAQAKVVCVAACKTEDIKSERILKVEAKVKVSDTKTKASNGLNALCVNTQEGSVQEGGTIQYLGEISCSTL